MKRHRLSSWTSDIDELLMGLTQPFLAGLRPVVISPTTVVEKILSAKSGLNEAFMSLLKGFEVCDIMFSAMFYLQRCSCV